MHLLFRSKSSGLAQTKPDFNEPPLRQFFDRTNSSEDEDDQEEDEEEEEEEEEDEEEDDEEDEDDKFVSCSPSTGRIRNYGNSSSANNNNNNNNNNSGHQLPPILDIIMAALRRSLVTCSVDRDAVASIDISWPTEVKHVSHVTFDRFNGFLGLPLELQRKVPKRVPSASVSVFGVSAKSMQCSYDERGNSVPTILLRMQKRLYSEGGLKAEGIFRINAENSQEEFVRSQLNKGLVPNGIDVHCLAGLIKAWLRELPSGVLDALTPEQVMHCNTEEECTQLLKLLPQMEAALLDWSINFMADVVQHEEYNKMNARNIAMVFAPNMTQMADPLTALIHAVQVMNFLKTLILKMIREREELSRLHPPSMCMDYSPISSSHEETSTSTLTPAATPNACERERPISMSNLGSISLDRLQGKDMNQDIESSSSSSSPSKLQSEITTATRTEFEVEERGDRGGDWLSLRKGVRKLGRHPVFQLTKQMSGKKTPSGEAWT